MNRHTRANQITTTITLPDDRPAYYWVNIPTGDHMITLFDPPLRPHRPPMGPRPPVPPPVRRLPIHVEDRTDRLGSMDR